MDTEETVRSVRPSQVKDPASFDFKLYLEEKMGKTVVELVEVSVKLYKTCTRTSVNSSKTCRFKLVYVSAGVSYRK